MYKKITLLYESSDGERTSSVNSRSAAERCLPSDLFDVDAIEVASESWSRTGETVEIDQTLFFSDYSWIAGRGAYTKDGQLQAVLESNRVPHNGSDAFVSKLCFNKAATKILLQNKGFATPAWQIYNIVNENLEALADEIFQNNPQPCIIKPNKGGSLFGLSFVLSKQEIYEALTQMSEYTQQVIVEEYIDGRDLAVGVVEGLRDEPVYTLPVVETVSCSKLVDHKTTHEYVSENKCPAELNDKLKAELAELSQKIFQLFELVDYALIYYVAHPTRGVYVLDIDTLPDITDGSVLHQSLEAVGVRREDFMAHIIERS